MNAPATPNSRLVKITWPLRSPAVAAVALALLVGIGSGLTRWGPAPIGRNLKVRHDLGLRPADVFLLRQPGQSFRLIDPDVESWDELSRLIAQRPADLLKISYVSTVARRGWWYPIREIGDRSIRIQPISTAPAFSDRELNQARDLYLDWLSTQPGAPEPTPQLRSGRESVDRIVPMNAAIDAASALILMILGYSVAGMPAYVKVAIAKRRMSRGLCGVCRYDLTMIEPTPDGKRCPECGALWDSTWPEALSAPRP